MRHSCAAVGCTRGVGAGVLMCRSHWFTVPGIVRRQVKETWSAYQGRGVGEDNAVYLDYLEARDEARRYVAELEGRRADFIPDAPRIRALQKARKERAAAS